ncbi:hypothetical protein GB937_007230 [Aspergillus fischeri]|nr:hypothetical protein GB937_007230 [Aspergillus fischeri]
MAHQNVTRGRLTADIDVVVVVVMVEEEKAQKTVSDKLLRRGKEKEKQQACDRTKDYREDGVREMEREPITGDAELLVWMMDY